MSVSLKCFYDVYEVYIVQKGSHEKKKKQEIAQYSSLQELYDQINK